MRKEVDEVPRRKLLAGNSVRQDGQGSFKCRMGTSELTALAVWPRRIRHLQQGGNQILVKEIMSPSLLSTLCFT